MKIKNHLINNLNKNYMELKDSLMDLKKESYNFDYVEKAELNCLSNNIEKLSKLLKEVIK